MSLIDYTHFFGDFNVGQLSAPDQRENLQQYIDMYESEYIEKCLGEDFSALFNAEIAETRFDNLQQMLLKRPSPITAYVFWHFQRSRAIVATGSGDARLATENATRSPEAYRMRIAWNKMVDRTRVIQCFLNDNATYPEFNICETDPCLREKQNDFGI